MTDEQHIARGLLAEDLMNNPAYQDLFTIVTEQMSKEILATSLDQAEERNSLYLTFHGLRSFNNLINSYRTTKDEIVARMDAEHQQEDD